MSVIDDLKTRRANVAARLASLTLTGSIPGDKPNANTADGGTTIDHVGYRQSLLGELRDLDEAILRAAQVDAAIANTDGSWEIESGHYLGGQF